MCEALRELLKDEIAAEVAKGKAEGKTEGVFDTLSALVHDEILTVKDAAARFGVSEAEFRQKMLNS